MKLIYNKRVLSMKLHKLACTANISFVQASFDQRGQILPANSQFFLIFMI